MIALLVELGGEIWSILEEAAVFLLAGFAVAAVLAVLRPRSLLLRFFRRGKIRSVLWGAAIGAPLPLCSCGVVPTALALSRQGATKGALVSFLISTPETGPDSIALSYALLDPIMTVFRPVAAFVTAVVGGIATNVLTSARPRSDSDAHAESDAHTDGDAEAPGAPIEPALPGASRRPWLAALVSAFRALLDETSHWLLLGIVLAALTAVLVPPVLIERYLGGGLVAMLAMLVLAIPVYTCASASTPIAAVLILKGLSPGAALVFLLSGPATNIPSLVLLLKVLGRRVMSIYLATIALLSVLAGMTLDALYRHWAVNPAASIGRTVDVVPGPLKVVGAVVLLALLVHSVLRVPVPAEWVRARDTVAALTGVRVTAGGLRRGAALVASVLYLASGLFTVGPGEVGLTTRFGRITDPDLGPGLHYRWPWPIGHHQVVPRDRIRRLEIGFRSAEASTAGWRPLPRPGPVSAAPAIASRNFWSSNQKLASESLLLMGDQNIIDIAFSVQYQVAHAVRYLYGVADPDDVVRNASIAALRSVVATIDVDAIYTRARLDVEQRVAQTTQALLDRYGSGIHLVGVSLLSVHPPEEVHAAFRDLASAHEDKILVVERATTFAQEAVNLADGDAAAMIESARGFKEEKILDAQGDALAFNLREAEYRRAPDLTRFRLHLEALEEVLPAAHKILRPGTGDLKDFDLWLVPPVPPRKNP